MKKWADYVITAVRFKKEKRHIEYVRVLADIGEQLVNEQTTTRSEIVRLLERGTTFVTAYKNNANKWVRGDDVSTVEVKGTKFIRTDGNSVEEDNLGELPEF